MRRMPAPLRPFLLTVLGIWIISGTAGVIYAQSQSIPTLVAASVIAAFLVEIALYVLPGFEAARQWVSRTLHPRALAAAIAGAAPLSYLIYSIPTGLFDLRSAAAILALGAVAAFWFVLVPRSAARDFLFIGIVAAVVLARIWSGLYPEPHPRAETAALGQLMWIRTGIFAVLLVRGVQGVGFGFLPTRRDWRIGALHFGALMMVLLPLSLALGFLRAPESYPVWWKVAGIAAATFLGMLWVVALSEEFFFRGLLQQWLTALTRSSVTGLLVTALLFGAAHLPFRGFPNWRFALLAAIAGLFYGLAYHRAGSIRAAMVAHALTNTVWRVVFQ
jgi:uncharacterized protein